MVEVFKTNVICPHQAALLVEQIHKYFDGYQANFDLDDCDKILRVRSLTGPVQADYLIRFLKESGYEATVLPDEPVVTGIDHLL